MTNAALEIVGHPQPEIVQARLRMSTLENGAVIFRSALGLDASLNEHLVWLWGLLQHERRLLKRIAAEGGKLRCLCRVPQGPVHLLPNAVEMLHLLGAELIVERK